MIATALPQSSALSRDMPLERKEPAVETGAGTITLLCCTELNGLRAAWEELQCVAPCSSAQTFLWAQAWAQHVLTPKGLSPAVAVGYGPDGRPLFLWPFELSRVMGLPVLHWLGQDHANYNLGLFRPGTEKALTASDLSRLLPQRQIASAPRRRF